jgi:bla regulator protein blaR1
LTVWPTAPFLNWSSELTLSTKQSFKSAPDHYTEGLLKARGFCLESPFACLSGITGASLNKRIVPLMTKKPGDRLNRANRVLLSLLATAAVVTPVVLGLMGAAQDAVPASTTMAYRFEVASIRPSDPNGMGNMVRMSFGPDSYSATQATVEMLLKDAYGLGDKQLVISAIPKESTPYDIEAKIDSATSAELEKLSAYELRAAHQQMLRALLTERFGLSAHWDERELAVYSLEIAKGGPKLHEAKPGDAYTSGLKDRNGNLVGPHMMLSRLGGGQISGQGVPLDVLIAQLSGQLSELIIDKTGLKGTYDFNLQWATDRRPSPIPDATDHDATGPAPANDSGPSLFTAIQEQLGLKLERTKGPVKVLVVDRLEHPSEN